MCRRMIDCLLVIEAFHARPFRAREIAASLRCSPAQSLAARSRPWDPDGDLPPGRLGWGPSGWARSGGRDTIQLPLQVADQRGGVDGLAEPAVEAARAAPQAAVLGGRAADGHDPQAGQPLV